MLLAGLAFLVPLLVSRVRFARIPVVVGELIVGMIIGKSGFDLVHPAEWLTFLEALGLAYLMFISGLEIDFDMLARLARRPAGRKLLMVHIAFFLSLLAGSVLVAYALAAAGWVQSPWFIALILSTTSVGIVVPTIKERGLRSDEYGQALLIGALVVDFGTMLLLTAAVALATGRPPTEVLLTALLFLAFAFFYRLGGFFQRHRFFKELAHATAQIGVRGAFMLIFVFAFLAERVGSEVILGAFLAGALVSLATREDESHLRLKLDAIGFGFLIPIFFIMVGVRFDVTALFATPAAAWLVPVLLIASYAVKIPAALWYRARYTARQAIGAGVLLTPGLSLMVAAAAIGFQLELLSTATHSAVLLLAILTAAISPIAFERLVPSHKRPKPLVLLVGANEFGMVLGHRLRARGYNLVLIDRDQAQIRRAQTAEFSASQADATSVEGLRQAGADRAEVLVAATRSDHENLEIARIAKETFAVGNVIALASDPAMADAVQTVGAVPVTPAASTLTVIENLVRHPDLFSVLTGGHAEDMAIEEVVVTNPTLVGRAVRDVDWPSDALLLAIRRGKEHVVPHGGTTFEAGDRVTVIGRPDEVDAMLRLFSDGV